MDAVVREALRLLPPASSTIRTTSQDDVVPLSVPVTGRDGKSITSIHVKKGSTFIIRRLLGRFPVLGLALIFRPTQPSCRSTS
jgi:hypothetical protein